MLSSIIPLSVKAFMNIMIARKLQHFKYIYVEFLALIVIFVFSIDLETSIHYSNKVVISITFLVLITFLTNTMYKNKSI